MLSTHDRRRTIKRRKLDLDDDGVPKKFRQIATTKMNLSNDNRPYLFVSIWNEKYKGLMDSGAMSCVVSGKIYRYLKSIGCKLKKCNVVIETADGTRHKALGYIDIPYTVRGIRRIIPTLVVEQSAVDIILGWDFWCAYRIKPCFVSSAFGIEVVNGGEKIEYDPNEGKGSENIEADVLPPKCIKVEEAHQLDSLQTRMLEEVKSKFPFCNLEGELNFTHLKEAHIDTGDAKPIRCKQRIDPPWKLKKIIKEIERLESRGIIERVEFAEWLNPILAVPKPNGSTRICLDARRVNAVTKKNAYPQQNANRILSLIGKANYISTLDMTDAYFQIKLNKQSRNKTAFAVPTKGTYIYKRMPMGLTNSGAELCSLIDTLFGSEFEPYAFPYLDDVVIVTETFEEHVEILSRIAEKFKFANLTISPQKSKFCYRRLRYLGHIIDEEGIAMDKSRIEAIEKYPTPTTVREVQRLIGMAGWYRRFIRDFARITAPITELIKKNTKFEWTEEREKAFRDLIEALTSAPVLAPADYNVPFEIQADASKLGCGAVLVQHQNGEEKVIAYMSQKFSATQRKYHVTELECLAVILAIEKFRPYVEGTRFKVITDHHALLWLHNLKDPTGRLARWSLRMQAYDFELVHRKGKLHVVPDALSRAVNVVNIEEFGESRDTWYKNLKYLATEKSQENDHLRIYDNRVYIKARRNENCDDLECLWRVCVPREQRLNVIRENHDEKSSCHFGRYKTTEKIKSVYYWPSMNVDIANYVKNCETCKLIKPFNQTTTPPAGNTVEYSRPWRVIATDIVGYFPLSNKGNRFLIVAVDLFTKFTIIKAVRNVTAKTVTDFIEKEVILKYACPEVIVSDNGVQYKSEVFKEMMRSHGIKHWLTANYFPQANPTECANKTVGNALKSFILSELNHRNWDVHVEEIANAMNHAVHTSTKETPYEIVFGMKMAQHGQQYQTTIDVNQENERRRNRTKFLEKIQARINEARERSTKRYNLRARKVEYKVGDVVYRKNTILSDAAKYFSKKLAPRFVKCQIVEKTGTNTYKLKDLATGKVAVHHAVNFRY